MALRASLEMFTPSGSCGKGRVVSQAAGSGPASPTARSPAPGPPASLAAHRLLDDPGNNGIGQVQVLGPLRHCRHRGRTCVSGLLFRQLQRLDFPRRPGLTPGGFRPAPRCRLCPILPRAPLLSSSSSSSTSPASASSGRSACSSTPLSCLPS